jgi:hypothetical protein
VNPAPRPPARLLLAGRFLAPRASLLALPEGPVAGLDLATGDLVGLAFGPSVSDPAALASRIDTWNEFALPGCPPVRELCWHLGRPLVSFDLRPLPCMPADLDGALVAARCGALGEQLARAGLGLPAGPADLALGPAGLLLRRPAIWPCGDERPLAGVLAELASRLLERAPEPVVERAPAPARRVRPALARRLPRSRPGRLILVAACAALTGLVVSSLASSSRGGAVANAAPVALAPPPLAAPLPAPRRQVEARARVARPSARGGPARVLLRASPPVVPATPPALPARPAATRVAEPQASRGWVEGLFVGS